MLLLNLCLLLTMWWNLSLRLLLVQNIIIIWKKREFDLLKKAKKSACRFKVKVHFKKAATAHIVFSVTFWEAPSWCVLWTGLVAADSGSVWIRKFFGKDFWYRTQNVSKAAATEGGAALQWHHTVGEQEGSRIPPYSKPARIWFCFLTKCVSWAGKGWTVRQSLLEECCCQQCVRPKQYRSLFFLLILLTEQLLEVLYTGMQEEKDTDGVTVGEQSILALIKMRLEIRVQQRN